MTSNTILSPYSIVSHSWTLHDPKPSYVKGDKEALALERHLNDLYRHFMFTMTAYMESSSTEQSEKVQTLLKEIIEVKKLLDTE